MDTNLLIAYDRRSGRILRETSYDDAQEALRVRLEIEHRSSFGPEVEVVVLSGGTRESIQRTHARYWMGEQP